MSGNLIALLLALSAIGLIVVTSWAERRDERSRRRHKADQSAHVVHSDLTVSAGNTNSRAWLVPGDPQQYAKAFIPPGDEKGQ